jgi:hypothetical protein
MLAMKPPIKTDRLGVSALERYFASIGWLFREQHLHDYGIDAHVEIVDKDSNPTGNLIAIQIKSGKSYFSEFTETSYVFRSDTKHIEYWTKHCLPVIVVLYNAEEDKLYWESVSISTITTTGKGCKIEIPKYKWLDAKSHEELLKLVQPPPYIQNLNRLRLDKNWIELVASGEVVYLEFESWINKSLPRFNVVIGCENRKDIDEEEWPTIYGAGLSIENVISALLPWANLEVDEDAYTNHAEQLWADECYRGHDRDGEVVFSMTFDDWYRPPKGIVPVSDNGEIEGYRLLLSLNEVGKAFLVIDEFLSMNENAEDITFTLE